MITFLFFIWIENSLREVSTRSKFLTRPNFGTPSIPSARNFFLPKKVRFPPTWWPAPPFIFFDNGLAKKFFLFCLRYEHMYLENIPLKWCYFVIWLKMEKNPQLRFPKNGIFIKKTFWSLFTAGFFDFFQKLSKSKGH